MLASDHSSGGVVVTAPDHEYGLRAARSLGSGEMIFGLNGHLTHVRGRLTIETDDGRYLGWPMKLGRSGRHSSSQKLPAHRLPAVTLTSSAGTVCCEALHSCVSRSAASCCRNKHAVGGLRWRPCASGR